MTTRSLRLWGLGGLCVLAGGMSTAHAVPVLQLYVEGASYDSDHESWVFELEEGSTDPVRLWVIGNTEGPGGKGEISDVRVSMVYEDPDPDTAGGGVDIDITPSTTLGFGGYADPSTPEAPTLLQINDDGDTPLLSDGTALPSHGTYGEGWEWQEFLLGDFFRTDSQIEDFIDEFPTPDGGPEGQINVYELLISGVSEIHFDAYNSVQAGNKARAVFAPFSHDAGTGTNQPVPTPGTLALLGLGLAGLGWGARRRP